MKTLYTTKSVGSDFHYQRRRRTKHSAPPDTLFMYEKMIAREIVDLTRCEKLQKAGFKGYEASIQRHTDAIALWQGKIAAILTAD